MCVHVGVCMCVSTLLYVYDWVCVCVHARTQVKTMNFTSEFIQLCDVGNDPMHFSWHLINWNIISWTLFDSFLTSIEYAQNGLKSFIFHH